MSESKLYKLVNVCRRLENGEAIIYRCFELHPGGGFIVQSADRIRQPINPKNCGSTSADSGSCSAKRPRNSGATCALRWKKQLLPLTRSSKVRELPSKPGRRDEGARVSAAHAGPRNASACRQFACGLRTPPGSHPR